MDRSFEVFNTDGTKNREVTQFTLLEVEINRHKKWIDTAVMNLNSTNMFLGYDWLVKHNPKVDWSKETMWFTRCLRTCRINYQDISFILRNWRTQVTDDNDKEQQEIGKEPDLTNPEDFPEYIWPFTPLFNKKKFEKLLERQKWDYEINLMEEAPKELNVKAYAITIKEDEALNQWLDKRLKAGLIKESKSRYAVSCFYIPKKDRSLLLWQPLITKDK